MAKAQQKNSVIALTSAVKQVVVVQKAAGDGATESWLRVTLEYPLDNPTVLAEIAELKGEAIHVELSHHQLTL